MTEEPDFDTSYIESMPREQLEAKLVQCINHLIEGVKLMEGANETIKWLAGSVVILGNQLVSYEPELQKATDRIIELAKAKAGLK